jgi:hypothetical protein
MQLDDKVRQLADSLESEFRRQLEKHRTRVAGFDDASHDAESGRVTYRRGDEVLYNGIAEEIGTFTQSGVFRWGWASGAVRKRPRAEVVKRELAALGLQQLLAPEVTLDDKTDAVKLLSIALHVLHADALFGVERGNKTVYLALFEAGGATAPRTPPTSERLGRRRETTDAPPPRAPSPSRPDGVPLGVRDDGAAAARVEVVSVPPLRPSSLPRAVPVREPAPTIFMPVTQAVFADVAGVVPGRTQQAIIIVTVDRGDRSRFAVEVVALEAGGTLHAVEASPRLRAVVADMLVADRLDGNGPWSRLVADVTMSASGAAIHMLVKR